MTAAQRPAHDDAARPPAVVMRGIAKRFGPVRALRGAGLEVAAGEIHALVGENGAGKTTLMNILCGLYACDEGSIAVHGEDVAIRSPADALKHRIGMVHQHFELVPPFSALENVVMGTGRRWWKLEADEHRDSIAELAGRYGFHLDLDVPVAEMAVGDQQKVEILRVLYAGARILILDEPTTHLTPSEVELLFGGVRRMVTDSGLSVVLITHKLQEVTAVADRMTVLRKGEVVGRLDKDAFDDRRIVGLIVGRTPPDVAGRAPSRPFSRATVFELRDVTVRADPPAVALREVAFSCGGGEMVGIAGVAGNGQSELLQTVVGLRRPSRGRVLFRGDDVTERSVRDRLIAGLVALAPDRLRDGILPDAPLYETFALGLHSRWSANRRWSRGFVQQETRRVVDAFGIATPDENAVTASLSGGNIQRLLVGKALALIPDHDVGLLAAMNPTNGLDVSATAFVQSELVRLCDAGHGVVLISEDLDELLVLCDRILVLHAGRITGDFRRDAFDRYEIGMRMVGGHAVRAGG